MNPKIFMQAEIANAFMKKHKLTVKKFLALDKKHNILQFIEKGYEPFHLMGNKGVLKELENVLR
ncbi:MAG: DUF3791 domain-containing protein [Fibromonadaceae bacterium]|nr:DUF3791 domain-containing protein [Fibromonadaceae bacterium]